MPFWRRRKKESAAETIKIAETPLDDRGNVKTDIQDTILSDPQVQEAMRKAGEEALKNEAVQRAVIQACKDNLTQENADKVIAKTKEWAADPETQAKARHFAGMAMVYAGQAGQAIMGCIEQGPAGVRFLAFLAGTASCVNAVFQVISNVSKFNLLWGVIAVFQVVFAGTTMLFEANPETISGIKILSDYQDLLIEYCKFLTVVYGRGLFYIFQGVLWLAQVQLSAIMNLLVGLGLCVVGVLNILIHFGIMPEHVVAKAKELAGQSYDRLPQSAPP